ncbi:MAG: hypothetical protein ACPGU4_00860 [Flavobacteriales bacterium]
MSTVPSDYFPLGKGTIVMIALAMVFVISVLVVYLWYDLQLQELNQTLQQLPNP